MICRCQSRNGQRLFLELLQHSTVNIPSAKCPCEDGETKIQSLPSAEVVIGLLVLSSGMFLCNHGNLTKSNPLQTILITKRAPLSKIRILNGPTEESAHGSNSPECITPKGLRKDSDLKKQNIEMSSNESIPNYENSLKEMSMTVSPSIGAL